jgi:XTP/dITP diphosphohydrolase
MRLLLGTHNAGKRTEMREALSNCGCIFLEPEEMGILDAPAETGTTFAENAIAKSRFFFERSKLPSVSDDSGIIVEALANELGIHTRRWGAGADATDAEWIEHFLRRMEQEENRRARFVCAIAFSDGTGATHLFEGSCDGVITPTLEAEYLSGLPISACFRPDGFEQVYSALSIEQKNSTSHRGKALRGFADMLRASTNLQYNS